MGKDMRDVVTDPHHDHPTRLCPNDAGHLHRVYRIIYEYLPCMLMSPC